MSTCLPTEVDTLTNNLRVLITAWLNASREEAMALEGTGLPGGGLYSSVNSPKDWIPRYIRTYLYT